jgi:hypothetical protein
MMPTRGERFSAITTFCLPGLTYIQSPQESAALNRREGPFVVISASGA